MILRAWYRIFNRERVQNDWLKESIPIKREGRGEVSGEERGVEWGRERNRNKEVGSKGERKEGKEKQFKI